MNRNMIVANRVAVQQAVRRHYYHAPRRPYLAPRKAAATAEPVVSPTGEKLVEEVSALLTAPITLTMQARKPGDDWTSTRKTPRPGSSSPGRLTRRA